MSETPVSRSFAPFESEAPFNLARAHRWLAVELNNLAWKLLQSKERTDDESEFMLHSAHAAWFHWKQAGALINILRAEILLTAVYFSVRRSTEAVHYAERCQVLLQLVGEAANSWDTACVAGSLALAYRLAGRMDQFESYLQQARQLAGNFTAEDHAVFDTYFLAPCEVS